MVRLDPLVHAFSPSRRRQKNQRGPLGQQEQPQGQQENQPVPFPLNRVPQDIVYEIAKWLPIESRLCLALTCKGFLTAIDYSQTLRRSHTLRLTETTVNPYFIDSNYRFDSERARFMSLLHKGLANDHPRWRCCFDCLTLHHPREFPALFHWGGYPSQVIGSNNYCGKGAISHGYIIVCPCLRLTVRDVERISRRVRQANPPIPRPFHHFFKRRAVEIPLHTCRHQYTNILVDINVSASFADTGDPGSLTLRTAFTLSGTNIPQSAEHLPLHLCPHHSIPLYINHKYGFGRDTAPLHRNRPTLPCTAETLPCGSCRTSITPPKFHYFSDPKSPTRITEHITFQTVRLMILDRSFPRPLYSPRLLFPRRWHGRADTFVGNPHYIVWKNDSPRFSQNDTRGRLIFSKNHL